MYSPVQYQLVAPLSKTQLIAYQLSHIWVKNLALLVAVIALVSFHLSEVCHGTSPLTQEWTTSNAVMGLAAK